MSKIINTKYIKLFQTVCEAPIKAPKEAFNKAIGTDGSVGIWHETYLVINGTYENIYGNMPPFGLGVAGKLEPIGKAHETFQQRLETK